MKLKLLILSDAGSIHTYRWVKSLSESGVDIILFSLSGCSEFKYEELVNVKFFSCNLKVEKYGNSIFKLKYLSALGKLIKINREYSPDIVHAHYASSYGLLGSLLNFHPFYISVWGSDIFDFPKKTFLHKRLLTYALRKADLILSTSVIMKNETQKYTSNEINVVPFGIDTNLFRPKQVKSLFNPDDLVIGTIKSLEQIYGIEYLIRAFSKLKNKYPGEKLKLLIAGEGSQRDYLESLSITLGLRYDTVFTGNVKEDKVIEYFNMMHIAVFPSQQESFGVAALEASACGLPVIASNTGGLPEIIDNNCTGILVEQGNVDSIEIAIERLFLNKDERTMMGINGRNFVIKNYEWANNVKMMIALYEKSI